MGRSASYLRAIEKFVACFRSFLAVVLVLEESSSNNVGGFLKTCLKSPMISFCFR